MRQIKLGGVLTVPAIAVGFWRLNYKTDVKTAEELVKTAMDCGANFFDNADIYGGGESEELFSRAIDMKPSIREKIILETKCGIVPGKCFDFSKKHIIESVEGSLKRLKTDYIDVLLLHRPDTLMDPYEVGEAFNELHDSGKVRYFGVSNENIWQIELLKSGLSVPLLANQLQLSITHCPVIQAGFNVNMFNDSAIERGAGIIEYSRLNNITIQAWSPLQYGFAKGTFIDSPKYPELNEKLGELALKYNVSKSAIAFSWLASHPANIQPITGALNKDHLIDCLKGADIILNREEWYSLYMSAGNVLP